MHSIIEAATPLWPVPMGPHGAAAQGQPGELPATCHCLHQPGVKVRPLYISL